MFRPDQRGFVEPALVFVRVDELPRSDERLIVFRISQRQVGPEVRTPGMPEQGDLIDLEKVAQVFRHHLAVAHHDIGRDGFRMGLVETLSAPSLVPGDDGIDIAPLPGESIVKKTRRAARSAVQIEQDGIVPVLSIDTDPLSRAVDIDIHRYIDTSIRHAVVDAPADPSDDEEDRKE